MDGLLLIDKPIGWTSFDVVAKVRGLLKQAHPGVKVGHTGTLDPLATGLLIVVVGNYTKKAEHYTKLDKDYQVTMILGQTSTTGDEEGEKTQISDQVPKLEQIQAALQSQIGWIDQIPPKFSAIKIDGQRAYKLARKGKEPKLEPRRVKINDVSIIEYKYPSIRLNTSVGSGVYIRSLVEDVGSCLGVGAYTQALRRTRVGDYKVDQAVSITHLNPDNVQNYLVLG